MAPRRDALHHMAGASTMGPGQCERLNHEDQIVQSTTVASGVETPTKVEAITSSHPKGERREPPKYRPWWTVGKSAAFQSLVTAIGTRIPRARHSASALVRVERKGLCALLPKVTFDPGAFPRTVIRSR